MGTQASGIIWYQVVSMYKTAIISFGTLYSHNGARYLFLLPSSGVFFYSINPKFALGGRALPYKILTLPTSFVHIFANLVSPRRGVFWAPFLKTAEQGFVGCEVRCVSVAEQDISYLVLK